MQRIKKIFLLIIRDWSYRWHQTRFYYWADERLYNLQSVYVMPTFYYRWLFHMSLWLVEFSRFRRFANWAIHTIPLHVRFKVA